MREIIALLIAVGMVFLYNWAMARWFDLKAVRWGHYLMEYGKDKEVMSFPIMSFEKDYYFSCIDWQADHLAHMHSWGKRSVAEPDKYNLRFVDSSGKMFRIKEITVLGWMQPGLRKKNRIMCVDYKYEDATEISLEDFKNEIREVAHNQKTYICDILELDNISQLDERLDECCTHHDIIKFIAAASIRNNDVGFDAKG